MSAIQQHTIAVDLLPAKMRLVILDALVRKDTTWMTLGHLVEV